MLTKRMPPGAAIEFLQLFRTLAVRHELFSRMRPLGAGIYGHGRIDPRGPEIVIPSALRPRRCLSETEMTATVHGAAEDPASSEHDALLVNIYAMAAAYSARDDGTVELPFDIETGERIDEVWQRWLRFDPVVLAREPWMGEVGRRVAAEHAEALGILQRHDPADT